MLYFTHAFSGLLAHKFSVRRMKNRRVVVPICLVTLIYRAHSEHYCFKLGIVPVCVSFPHRLLPFPSDARLPREAIREVTSLLRRAPSLRVASSSSIRCLRVVCHCQSLEGTCVFNACSPCFCQRRGDSRGDLVTPPYPVFVCGLPLAESVACSSSAIARALEVSAFIAFLPCEVCLTCYLMDGDLGGEFLDVDGGLPLDLLDFGLWLWIWLQQRLLLGCVAH